MKKSDKITNKLLVSKRTEVKNLNIEVKIRNIVNTLNFSDFLVFTSKKLKLIFSPFIGHLTYAQ